jgi:hypothetical protein
VERHILDANYVDIKSSIYKNRIVKKVYDWVVYGNKHKIVCYPTFKCNYDCPYCNVRTRGKMPEKFPEEHSGKEWADMFNRLEPSLIGLSGGELFLEVPGSTWSIREFLENIDRKHIVAITSNLSWDTDKVLPWLTKARSEKRIHITFSFHPSMTNIEPFLEKMKILRKNGIVSTASIVAVPAVFSQLESFKQKFDAAGIRFAVHTFLDPAFKYTQEQKDFLIKFNGTIRDKEDDELSFDFDNEPVPKNCVAGKDYYLFVPNGDAYACQSGFFCVNSPVHEKWRANKSEFHLGNVFDNTFKPRNFTTTNCKYPCSEYCDRAYAKPVAVSEKK